MWRRKNTKYVDCSNCGVKIEKSMVITSYNLPYPLYYCDYCFRGQKRISSLEKKIKNLENIIKKGE